MSCIIDGVIDFMDKFKFNEPWKHYVPQLYSQAKEPVFSFETIQPIYHELQLDQNTTLKNINDFLKKKEEHLNDRDDIYFWVDTEPKQKDNYLVTSTHGTTLLQGLEYPTGIYFKSGHSSNCIKIMLPWIKQDKDTHVITLPDLENLHTLLVDSLFPPQDALGSAGQLHTINSFITSCGRSEITTLRIRDLKVILNCCGYDNFIEPTLISTFYLGQVETTLLISLGNGKSESSAHHRPYGILLLIEKINLISTLYMLLKMAPVPSILCYVTSEKPTTLVWSLFTYMEEYSRFKIELTTDGMYKEPLLTNRTLMVTPWTLNGKRTKLSLTSLYFHSKQIRHHLETDPEEFISETIRQTNMYKPDTDLDHKVEIVYDKCLPEHNDYLLRDCDTLTEYRESIPNCLNLPDELLVLSILHHTAPNANAKLRYCKNFYPKDLELPVLYYLHISYPQTTLEDEEQALKENRNLLSFSLNYHRHRPKSPPTWYAVNCTDGKGEDICINYLN